MRRREEAPPRGGLGCWFDYAASGYGGNVQLRGRYSRNFRFSILERVSPDLSAEEVIRREASGRCGCTRKLDLNSSRYWRP